MTKMCPGINYQLALTITAISFGSGFQHIYCSDAVFLQSINHLIKEFIEKTLADYEGYLKDRNEIGVFALQFLSLIYSVGSFIGCLLIPVVINNIGRKSGLLWNNGTILISVLLQSLSKRYGSYGMLFFGRFLIGLSTWLGTGVSLIFIVEISPLPVRGILGASYSLAMSIAVLVTQILVAPNVLGNEEYWSWLFAVCIIPMVCQIIILPFCPDANKSTIPRKEAQKAFPTSPHDVEKTNYHLYVHSCNRLNTSPRVLRVKNMLNSKIFKRPSVISNLLMMCHYLGAVGIMSFIPGDTPLMSSIGIVSTGVCMLFVDRIGRKNLLLWGILSMSLIYVLLFTCILWSEIWDISIGLLLTAYIILLIAYVIAFSFSLGTIPWFLICELSSHETRPDTTAVAFMSYWITHWCFQIFLWIFKDIINAYILPIFSALALLLGIYLHKSLPETHGETLAEFSSKRQRYITTK